MTDANGVPITTFTGSATVCFNLSVADMSNVTDPLTIQMWNGGAWVNINTTFTAGTPNKVCGTVSGW